MGSLEGPWEVEYYETQLGRAPVFEWIQNMSAEEQALALRYIDQLALLGTEAHPPLIGHLGGKLYELRWKSADRQHRIAYFAWTGRKFVLLHGFIKKTRTTAKRDLDTSRKRMRDYERRHKG